MEPRSRIEQLLGDGEKVLWEEKPQRHPYILSAFHISLMGMLFLTGPVIVLWGIVTDPKGSFGRVGPMLFVAPFLFFGLLMFGAPLLALWAYRHEEYVVTNRRLFLQGGVRGQLLKIIQLADIRSLTVTTNWIDRKYETATIKLYVGERGGESSQPRYDRLSNIARPAEGIKLIQSGIEENRTAIQ
jgi:hypothetical protein